MMVIRGGRQIIKCDACDKAPENLDQFDAFFISWPVSERQRSTLVGDSFNGKHGKLFLPKEPEPTIKYLMFKHHPGVPETLHTCPWCAKIIRKCLKTNKLHELPDGPLKGWLLAIVAKGENKFRAFQIHYLKDSRIGNA